MGMLTELFKAAKVGVGRATKAGLTAGGKQGRAFSKWNKEMQESATKDKDFMVKAAKKKIEGNAFLKMYASTWNAAKNTGEAGFKGWAKRTFARSKIGVVGGGMTAGPAGAVIGAAAPTIGSLGYRIGGHVMRHPGRAIGTAAVLGGLNGMRRAAVDQAEKNTMHMNTNNKGMRSNNLSTDGLTLALSRSRHRG